MESVILTYIEENKELKTIYKEIEENIFDNPYTTVMKGRIFGEVLSKIIAEEEEKEYLLNYIQVDRIRELKHFGIFDGNIAKEFHNIRVLGNDAAHNHSIVTISTALEVHKSVFELICWFIEEYMYAGFIKPEYIEPKPHKTARNIIDKEEIEKIIKEISIESNNYEKKDKSVDVSELDKKCLIQELSKLKESSKEAVEGLNKFSDFKKYMHITRDAQNELEDLIMNACEKENAQLILVCGSVGDGKSHIISYFKDKYPVEMSKFTLHNDATESLEPNKTSIDTLNDVLNNFSDENIEESDEKFILAINLGTLNNFIDSEYGDRFTKLKKFVSEKKILEQSIEENSFDKNSNFQFINFSDYHLFTLKDGKVNSNYVRALINKVTEPSELNGFYNSYKKNCTKCLNFNQCPIKANYELLSKVEVQNSIIDLLVQCIIKNKIIISTRALLNFIYELLIARAYVDVNSPMFKQNIAKLNKIEYIKSLTPNIIFSHKELSFIFDALNTLDPLNVRNDGVDSFVIEFNNSDEVISYFKEYIHFPKGYLDKLGNIKIGDTGDKNIRPELLKLFIRSYYICGREGLLCLKDEIYEKYIINLYNWNKGEKSKLKDLYNEIKNGITNWNGKADKNHINIFLGQNQIKYKISEELDIKADVTNLKSNSDSELIKFLTKMKLKFKTLKEDNGQELDIDYTLYKLLNKVGNGYRPNKKDKNHFIKFIEFISKLEESGSQNERIIFTEKNREENKKYRLEYNDEFEEYRFVEM